MDAGMLLWVLAVVLVLVGLAGLVLPAVPGPPVLFVGLLVAAWAEDFTRVGPWTLVALAVLMVLAYVVDFAAGAFGASRFGASPRAATGAAIGAVVGIFFGIAGILVGPFAGAVIGELSARRRLHEAGRAGVGATIGLAIGAAVKLALGFSMVGLFVVVRLLSGGS